MKTRRYLILPAEGIRLSDSTSAANDSAKTLLGLLRPQNKAAVASLSRKLLASISDAKSPVSRAAESVTAAGKPVTARALAGAEAGALRVIESLGDDGVTLVAASQEVLAALRQSHPGIRVIEEKFCHPALAPRVQVPPRPRVPTAAAAAARRTAPVAPVVVEVIRGDTKTPLRGAEVIAFRTDQHALTRKTNASGKASFPFGIAATRLKWLYVYHEEPGLWGYFKANVKLSQQAARIVLSPLDLAAQDSLRHFHQTGKLSDGKGVRVGIIDSGADPDHPDLVEAIEGGANCVPESTREPDDFGPDGAHGTHVAGIIAARGKTPTGVRGIAPGATLRIYRVFESGNPGSGSSFAVIDAIERSIADKCDIINLSLAFDPGTIDEGISDALAKARRNGILAIAAAGNEGRQPVAFPASDATCVAVSAAGRKGLFPRTATEVDDIAAPFGQDRRDFLAGFSNVGPELDAAGAGVGVVSTFPGGYGPMSGTSMASPAVAGVAARLLAAKSRILAMPRNAARADAMRTLLMDACRSLQLGILFEGNGLPQ